MAQLPGAFNSSEEKGMDDFSPVPVGKYLAMIVESELKDNSNQNGKILSLRVKIIDGEHKGRLVFDNLNIVNPSEQAMEISRKALASIGKAVGAGTFTDTEVLHGKPMLITVGMTKATPQYPARNKISFYDRAPNSPLEGTDKPNGDVAKTPWS